VTAVSVPSVTVTITGFDGQYAALAAWTGDSPDDLRADDDYHDETRDQWLAWDDGPLQRLGCVGVLPGYRRRGLARAMIAAAFGPLIQRGVVAVSAEVDETNTASNALMAGLGGRVAGGTVELRRPARGHSIG
jgi:GNAT superfamily N-acetyltransferase